MIYTNSQGLWLELYLLGLKYMPYELAVFLLKYDLLIISVILLCYNFLAAHIIYNVGRLNLMNVSELYPHILRNMGMYRQEIFTFCSINTIIAFLLFIVLKIIGYEILAYCICGLTIFYSALLYPLILLSAEYIVNKKTSNMYDNLVGIE